MSSQRHITAILEASQENREFLKRALTNTGVTFTQENEAPNTPLKLYLPEHTAVVLTLLHAINFKADAFKGEIILQDGRSFNIDIDGQKKLLDVVTNVMNQQPVPTAPNIWWADFVPEIKLILTKVADIVEWYPKAVGQAEEKVTKYFVGLIGLIILGMFALAWLKIVSGDAFVFVVGTVLGYVFGFLTRYLGLSGGGD